LYTIDIFKDKSSSTLQKPDKIFLENSNLSFALTEKPDIGTVRETFILNQLLNAGISVTSPPEGDFFADGLTIEVGGKGKSGNQVRHLQEYLIDADNIETGAGNRLPV